MRIEVGTEKVFIRNRLSDIICIAECGKPVDDDWKGFAKALARLVIDQAQQAQKALAVLSAN